MKVLIADDDRVLTHLVSSRLRTKGWQVTVAHDSMQAFMFAMQSQPDVITLDISMPGGTGFEVLRRLKQSARTEQIPVVVLSGSITPEDEAKVRGLGAVAFVQKPVEVDALHDTLEGFVMRRAA